MNEKLKRREEPKEVESHRVFDAASEAWDVFKKHNLSFDEGLRVMACLTRTIGRKVDDEAGTARRMVEMLEIIMPEFKYAQTCRDVPNSAGRGLTKND